MGMILGQPASSKNDEHRYCQSNGDLGGFQKIYHLPMSDPERDSFINLHGKEDEGWS